LFQTSQPEQLMETVLVLTDLAPAAERARRYAAQLAGPLGARVVLLHIYQKVTLPIDTGVIEVANYVGAEEVEQALQTLADKMAVPTTVEVTDDSFADALSAAMVRYQPRLLVLGFTATESYLNGVLFNRALPLLRHSTCPVVFVPEKGPLASPRRVMLAVDGEAFSVAPAVADVYREILRTWSAEVTLVHANTAVTTLPGREVVQAVVNSGIMPASAEVAFRQPKVATPEAGIFQTLVTNPADLLVLVARRRSFLGQLFHRSVTARVLQRAAMPMLLLPEANTKPQTQTAYAGNTTARLNRKDALAQV
jgi:nucleotide-binding universal stress UspA family protein